MAVKTRKPAARAKAHPPIKATKKPAHRVIAPAPKPRAFGPAGGTEIAPSSTPMPVPPQVGVATPKPRGRQVVAGNAAGSNPAHPPVRKAPPVKKAPAAGSIPSVAPTRKPKKATPKSQHKATRPKKAPR
jgi:hypothetical protein